MNASNASTELSPYPSTMTHSKAHATRNHSRMRPLHVLSHHDLHPVLGRGVGVPSLVGDGLPISGGLH